MSPSSEVTTLLRSTLLTKLVKFCVVSLFVLSTVVRPSPGMFFRFDLSSSKADIDFVLLKLRHHISSTRPDFIASYSLRVTRIDGEHMVLVQRPESLVLDVDSKIIL